MSRSLLRTPALTYLVSLSLLGLFLAGMLALYPPTVQESFVGRKLVVGSIFGLICMLGILAVFSPRQCSRLFDHEKEESHVNISWFASHGTSPLLKGHHPDCENFSAHVFRIDNRTFCTACTGLLFGALISLVGTFLYFFGDWHPELNSLLAVCAGVLGVGSGLFQFKVKRSLVRLFLNTFFVLGAFLALVGIDALIQSVLVDLFLIALIVFWLLTRISLSQWDHKRICYACDVASCELRKMREMVVSIYGGVRKGRQ